MRPDGGGLQKYILPYYANPQDLYATALPMREISHILNSIQSRKMLSRVTLCLASSTTTSAFRFRNDTCRQRRCDAMIHFRHLPVIAVLLTTVTAFAQPADVYGQNAQEASAVHFIWAFGALVGPQASPELITVDRDLALRSGDRLKFMVAPKTPCFVYLFHLSHQKELALLYPREFAAEPIQTEAVAFVPSDDRWFSLDEKTGTEKFFLLASHQRLPSIEDRYRRYLSADGEMDRQAAVEEILETIKDLRREHLRNPEPVERPIHLGGNFRGVAEAIRSRIPDLSAIAVEISASTFYSRTFTIDHR
jgi:hypothetical protein